DGALGGAAGDEAEGDAGVAGGVGAERAAFDGEGGVGGEGAGLAVVVLLVEGEGGAAGVDGRQLRVFDQGFGVAQKQRRRGGGGFTRVEPAVAHRQAGR